LAAELRREFGVADVELIRSGGGRFEVVVNGRLIYSKAETGRHAEPGEVVAAIQSFGI